MSRRAGVYPALLSIAAAVVALDQVTKDLALRYLAEGPINLVPGALTLRLTYNSGGAFGLLQGLPGVFLVLSLVITVGILLWARNVEERSWGVPLGLILGGGVGNVVDRVFRSTGGRVVDFVDLHVWPVFNLADSAIVVGVGVILVLSARSQPSTPEA
ncbi:N/A [soil metagenome]